ncbi:hypothetical protein BDR07DRAFT_1376297 [Suillus spraguei]|nr:hypothetical protein BDR07DRAFT_1376297 [Suillus spraguei]
MLSQYYHCVLFLVVPHSIVTHLCYVLKVCNAEEHTWSFSQYWEYLDKVLDELKDEARQKHVFPQARADYIKQFFTECLQQDLQTFPGSGSLALSLDSVTVGWQRAIHEKLMW